MEVSIFIMRPKQLVRSIHSPHSIIGSAQEALKFDKVYIIIHARVLAYSWNDFVKCHIMYCWLSIELSGVRKIDCSHS